jgi:topoisomerase-4 subunit A
VLDRIHILEGRQLVLLNIDEVIAIIRQPTSPRQALIARFKLSDRQAEDILEIRLRQLARLEAIKIEQELKELREEQEARRHPGQPGRACAALMIKEIEADAKQFGDARRTLIQAEKRAVAEVKVVDEPVTVVVSQKGWVRAQKGWASEAAGNGGAAPELHLQGGRRPVRRLRMPHGRHAAGLRQQGTGVYSMPVAVLPGARGDGQPVTTLHRARGRHAVVHYFAGPAAGCCCPTPAATASWPRGEHDVAPAGGKAFITWARASTVCRPSLANASGAAADAATHVACASTGGAS